MIASGLVRRAIASAQGDRGYTRAGIIGTLVVIAVAATCVRLGLWQLDRLEQRRERNALFEQRMTMPTVDVDAVDTDGDALPYRRIRLAGSCVGDHVVLAARSRHGAPGVHLLCLFRTNGGRDLLLDRGWLPSPDARTVAPEHDSAPPADTVIEALAMPFPEGRDVLRSTGPDRAIEHGSGGVALGEPAPPVIYRLNHVQAEAVTGTTLPTWYAQAVGPQDALPIPADPPDLGEGPHLGYAVQWFSFAAIGLIGWLVIVARRQVPPRSAPRPE